MNEFIEQFLIESREYVEQATADLLALEKTPDDKTSLDSVFRAFHTLKGGAGIIDFTAMAEAVHAAEDALSAARVGAGAVTPELIGDCLTCLDQVVQWLDILEKTETLPAGAPGEAAAVVARFTRTAGARGSAPPAASVPVPGDWVGELLSQFQVERDKATLAIRYVPAPQGLFDGEDPCARIAALPGLLCVDIAPVHPWPPLDELDPFACNIVLTALCAATHDAVMELLKDVAGQCETRILREAGARDPGLSGAAKAVLDAQIAMVESPAAHGAAGRLASAGAVAAAVLRHAGRPDEGARIARATEAGVANGDPGFLRAALEVVLNPVAAPAEIPPAAATRAEESAVRTLRIDASRVDALVDLTGELTVAKNSVGHASRLAQAGDPVLAALLRQRYAVLDRLVGELQRTVLAMRVLPLRHVFQRFPRLLREISAELGKPANLIIEGAETEADKVIVEMLFEPLLHVLRNAIGHGIEAPSTRQARRKPAIASIRLRAERRSENVIVEVIDDGQGIDVARIRQVAAERGMMTPETLDALSDEAASDLIFEPGFSTASEVTGLSGRGVGMDAVRHAVARLGGSAGVESHAGEGTTVRFTLPFSVMMTRVMVVEASGQSFGIPLESVIETLRVAADRIAPIGATHAFVLRNRTMPLLELAEALGLSRVERDGDEATLVVTRTDGHHGALRVDRIGERMEVMLKPLDGLLAGTRGVAGSTLLGDGSVLLILDIGELFQ